MRSSGEWLFGGSWRPFAGLSYGEGGLVGEQDYGLRLPPGTHGFAGGGLLFQAGCSGRTGFHLIIKKNSAGLLLRKQSGAIII